MKTHESAKVQSQEKMLEALFEYAATCNADNILEENPNEADQAPEDVFSQEFNIKMHKLIAKHDRQESLKRVRKKAAKYLPKVAVFIFILLGSFTLVVTSVHAWRVKALNTILNIRDKYTAIQSYDPNDGQAKNIATIPQDWDGYVPEYIPDGYKIERTEKHAMSQSIYFTNEENKAIRFTQYFKADTDLRIDTENTIVENIKINDSEAVIAQKQGFTSIVWEDDYLFYISGEAEKTELIKMVTSIKKIN